MQQVVLVDANELKAHLQTIKSDLLEIKKDIGRLNVASQTPKRYRRKEAMAILGIGSTRMNEILHNGDLPFTKVGGTIYIKPEDIEAYLNKSEKK